MTVIDEVLATEKASEQKLEAAKTAAAEAILVAKKAQATELQTEQVRLQAVEAAELAAFEKKIGEKVAEINLAAEKKVAAIESSFSERPKMLFSFRTQ